MSRNVSNDIIPPDMVEFSCRGYLFRVDGSIVILDVNVSHYNNWYVSGGMAIVNTGYSANIMDADVQLAYREALVNQTIMSE